MFFMTIVIVCAGKMTNLESLTCTFWVCFLTSSWPRIPIQNQTLNHFKANSVVYCFHVNLKPSGKIHQCQRSGWGSPDSNKAPGLEAQKPLSANGIPGYHFYWVTVATWEQANIFKTPCASLWTKVFFAFPAFFFFFFKSVWSKPFPLFFISINSYIAVSRLMLIFFFFCSIWRY